MFGDLPVYSHNRACCLCYCGVAVSPVRNEPRGADSHSLGAECPPDFYSPLAHRGTCLLSCQTKSPLHPFLQIPHRNRIDTRTARDLHQHKCKMRVLRIAKHNKTRLHALQSANLGENKTKLQDLKASVKHNEIEIHDL